MLTHIQVKTALVTFYNEGYERFEGFIEGLEKTRKDTKIILEKLGSEIVLDEMVYMPAHMDIPAEGKLRSNAYSARILASRLKKIDFDVLVLPIYNWSGGNDALVLVQSIPDTPIILWMDPVGPNGSLCGFIEMTTDLKSIGKRFKPIIGKTPRDLEDIRAYMKAAAVARRLRSKTVGVIGNPPPGFLDVTANKSNLRNKFGIDIIDLPLSEVFYEIQRLPNDKVTAIVNESRKKAGKVEVSDENLIHAVKLGAGLEAVVEKHHLDAYAIGCFGLFPYPPYEISLPCLGASRLLSNKGIPCGCEADLTSEVTALILTELTGKPSVVYDIGVWDIEKNVLSVSHCSDIPTDMARSLEDIVIAHPCGNPSATGAVLKFPLKQGIVTIAELDANCEKLLIITGETLYCEKEEDRGHPVRLNSDIREVVKSMTEMNMPHHVCLVTGNVRPELEAFCEILSIKAVIF